MKLKNKVKILELLGAGELEKALDELVLELKASKSGADFLKTARSLSGQLGKLKKDKLDGVITYEQESVAFNKLQVKLQTLVEAIEKDKPTPPPTPPPTGGPKDPPPTPPQKSSNWWPWLAIPALAFGGWWLFIRQGPITPIIKICTTNRVGNLNVCEEDMHRFSLSETLRGIVVTATFEGLKDKDPIIKGNLKDSYGNDFHTNNIQLTMPEGESVVGYSSELVPANGLLWKADTYTLELFYKDKLIGENQFVIYEPPSASPSFELVPFDSIKPKRNAIDRLNGLLKDSQN